MANASNNDRFGGRFLIQDTNHMSDIPDAGGRFMIQDHDHMSDAGQSQAQQAQDSDRQQGGDVASRKSPRKRSGGQAQ